MHQKKASKEGKRERVLAGAKRLFLRYGFRRVTMGEIAELAGMSRPALYLIYANKEEVFRAVVASYHGGWQHLAEQRLLGCEGLEAKLESLARTWVVEPYVELMASPEASELFEAGHALAPDIRSVFIESYMVQLEGVLRTSEEVDVAAVEGRGFSLGRVVELIAKITVGLKREVGSVEELESMLADVRRWQMMWLVGG